jgi:hypothetical protein
MASCYKCNANGDDVEMRQCDYHLCKKCELNRLKEMAEIKKCRKTNTSSELNHNGLEQYVESLRTKSKPPPKQKHVNKSGAKEPQSTLQKLFSTPSKLLNTGFAAASSLLVENPSSTQSVKALNYDENSSKCVHPNCNIISSDKPLCACSVCSSQYHVACAGLTKPPARKWTCANCKDMHSLTKNLMKTVANLQREIVGMKSSQSDFKKSQEVLQTENVKLKSRHLELKKLQESLQTENKLLRREVDQMKDALTKQRGPSSDPSDTLTADGSDSDYPSASFVIGDSMLRDFDSSMFVNTQFKTLSGATVSKVFEELNGRNDLKSYKDIVIHAGTNDISKNIALDDTISSMEASITLIMLKAPTARIHISAVCPRTKGQLQHTIDTLNAALKDLATRLDCDFIESGSQMVYKNGRVDETQLVDGLHLSERGLDTLTTAFVESVPSLLKSEDYWSQAKQNKRSKPNQDSKREQKYTSQNPQRSRDHSETSHRVKQTSREILRNKHSWNGSRERYLQQHNTQRDFRSNFRRDNRTGSSYSGCFNCGLTNHNQNTCFHKERLRCTSCNCLGHKAKYCFDEGNSNVSNWY